MIPLLSAFTEQVQLVPLIIAGKSPINVPEEHSSSSPCELCLTTSKSPFWIRNPNSGLSPIFHRTSPSFTFLSVAMSSSWTFWALLSSFSKEFLLNRVNNQVFPGKNSLGDSSNKLWGLPLLIQTNKSFGNAIIRPWVLSKDEVKIVSVDAV